MDRLIDELRFENVIVIDRDIHKTLEVLDEYKGHTLEHSVIEGYDHPSRYSREIFDHVKDCIGGMRFFGIRTSILAWVAKRTEYNSILLIKRLPGNSYYESDHAEIKTSGAGRRSIPNFNQITRAISTWRPSVITLEGKTLQQQYLLFATARVVIAQHGAALANVVFCSEGAALIEILPNDLRLEVLEADYFGKLAQAKGLKYISIEQEHSHSDVRPDDVVRALSSVVPI